MSNHHWAEKQATHETAIALCKSGWWKGKSAEEVVAFQLCQHRLCMPFADFHKAIEEVLGRGVFTHEFADPERLYNEMVGLEAKPTVQEAINKLHDLTDAIIVTVVL